MFNPIKRGYVALADMRYWNQAQRNPKWRWRIMVCHFHFTLHDSKIQRPKLKKIN